VVWEQIEEYYSRKEPSAGFQPKEFTKTKY
jgi:hypothetical protein